MTQTPSGFTHLHNALDKIKFICYNPDNTKLMRKGHSYEMYNFTLHVDIMYAINTHNNLIPGDKLTFLDGALICFIKSFQDRDQKFFVSNKELSRIFVANESTIQRSINKLTKMGLLHSEKIYSGQLPRRYLTYDKSKLQELLNLTQ